MNISYGLALGVLFSVLLPVLAEEADLPPLWGVWAVESLLTADAPVEAMAANRSLLLSQPGFFLELCIHTEKAIQITAEAAISQVYSSEREKDVYTLLPFQVSEANTFTFTVSQLSAIDFHCSSLRVAGLDYKMALADDLNTHELSTRDEYRVSLEVPIDLHPKNFLQAVDSMYCFGGANRKPSGTGRTVAKKDIGRPVNRLDTFSSEQIPQGVGGGASGSSPGGNGEGGGDKKKKPCDKVCEENDNHRLLIKNLLHALSELNGDELNQLAKDITQNGSISSDFYVSLINTQGLGFKDSTQDDWFTILERMVLVYKNKNEDEIGYSLLFSVLICYSQDINALYEIWLSSHLSFRKGLLNPKVLPTVTVSAQLKQE